MKLSKKNSSKPRVYPDTTEYKKGERFNPRTMILLHSAIIPHGKYQKKTLEWVMENDEWYWNWMQKEHLISSWGLCCSIIKSSVQQERTQYLGDDNGHQWLSIYLVEEQCEPSKWL